MKRINNLYNNIISIENLNIADKKAQRGKKNQVGVINHNLNKKQNILELHNTLVNREFSTSKYSVFTIKEKKDRIISVLPYFPDRIVHHSIMNFLEKIFVDSFISQTYSCIKKRGIHKNLSDLTKSLKDVENTKFCLKIDIRKFYESVNLNILKNKLQNKFKDKDLLILLSNIIDSNSSGLPLGNYLSQFLANFYLNSFDHWIKQDKKIRYYMRYCDDIIILANNKEELHELRKSIQEYLKINLNLELSNYQVFPITQGIDFLGYVSYPTHIRLRKSIKKKMIKTLNNRNRPSYYGWCVHANCKNLIKKYGL